ncbi:hypothetical protein BKA56DRAFT_624754 [Ilyonectria sp. MPI-CAGE-AT-0026]|nr:hypothetical protein BKA56DRAFT_624754 [Ilyonectria sp. MPI-CAGE-AT-0026]
MARWCYKFRRPQGCRRKERSKDLPLNWKDLKSDAEAEYENRVDDVVKDVCEKQSMITMLGSRHFTAAEETASNDSSPDEPGDSHLAHEHSRVVWSLQNTRIQRLIRLFSKGLPRTMVGATRYRHDPPHPPGLEAHGHSNSMDSSSSSATYGRLS